jgi:hypothetical protein
MKNYKWLLLLVFVCVTLRSARSQVHSELAIPPNGDNERAEISQWIGLVKITIDYHSPNVHGGGGDDRTDHIWGGLVGYGFADQGTGFARDRHDLCAFLWCKTVAGVARGSRIEDFQDQPAAPS